MPKLTAELSGPLKQMQVCSDVTLILFEHALKNSASRIVKVSAEAKLPVEEEEYVQSFRPQLMMDRCCELVGTGHRELHFCRSVR